MTLTADKIHSNYEKHLKIIDTYIGERKESCKKLIEHMEKLMLWLLLVVNHGITMLYQVDM